MIDAVRDCLHALLDAPPSLDGVARALDRLVAAVHDTPAGDVTDPERDAPESDWQATQARIAERFPQLGSYWYSGPEEAEGDAPEPLVGDALSDLAEIADDLVEVLWTHDNIGAEDARWLFHFGYQTHWGEHLHRARLWLHLKLRDAG